MTKVGVLGGGQLARMLAQAGSKLDMEFMFLCPDTESCAAAFGEHLIADYEDELAQQRFLDWSDLITYEFENIPTKVVTSLENQIDLHPSSSALEVSRDRCEEKKLFKALGISTAQFESVDSLEDLTKAVSTIGLPALLKTRSGGYDGKGQVMLKTDVDLQSAWAQIGELPCIVESVVLFDRELSIIAARSATGEVVFYPLSENHHRDGILRLSLSLENDPVQSEAEVMISRIMDELSYVGVLALELFQKGRKLYANEMAPRVHNTGHWTIEGARTSQFENHLRAVAGMPLGDTSVLSPTAMINLIGQIPTEGEFGTIPNIKIHNYQKAERPGRKVGHITLTSDATTNESFKLRVASTLRATGELKLAETVENKGLYHL